MKQMLFWLAAIVSLNHSVDAQVSHPRIEVFGGYAYYNVDPNADLIFAPGLSIPSGRQGFGAGAAGNWSKYFGVVADFSYHTKRINLGSPSEADEVKATTFNFLFGPRVTIRGSRVNGFAHVLVGGVRMKVEGGQGVPAVQQDHKQVGDGVRMKVEGGQVVSGSSQVATTNFAFGLGGGVDVRLNRRLAIRALQIDYLPAQAEFKAAGDKNWTHNFRVETGIVIRW